MGKTINAVIVAIIALIFALLASKAALGIGEPTQQFNKIYLNPFYRESMALNTNYSYSMTINPPDKISSVVNAIVSFNAQINGQTQMFTLWVNGKSCNTANYSVATAFSTTGNVQFSFDCSNTITQAGTYNMTLRSSVNTGAMTGWVDITYMNNPKGTTDIFGTEYVEGDDATIFLLLKDSGGNPIANGTCTIDVYYPSIANLSHPIWINKGLMLYKENGLYFYDFTVPLNTGLYMVNAHCSYISDNNFYYSLSSNKAPIRNVTTGTYAGDPFVLDDYTEWLYTQCDSGTGGGGNKVCDAYYEWNITSPTLGNVTQLFVSYLGENNGANLLTMYYLNWSNNNWTVLPNTLLFKATASSGVPIGVDEYLSNSIPVSNQSIRNGIVRIRTYTTSGSTFKQWDNWIALRTSQYATTIQDLKGSGEIHVSASPAGENKYFKVLTCNGFVDGRCGIFTNDNEFDQTEGEIEHYLNVTATSTRTRVGITFNTPFTVDCTALYWIKWLNGTSWQDFTDYSLYSQPSQENCIITLQQDMSSGTTYHYWIKEDNYMKWEVEWSKTTLDKIKESVIDICKWRNYTYNVPITESSILPDDTTTLFCLHLYDDFYYVDIDYNDSQPIDNAGEFASYVQELRFYRKDIYAKIQYLDIATAKNFSGIVSIGGTEYQSGETGKIVVRLIKGSGDVEAGATCNTTIFYPNQTTFINQAPMTEFYNGTYAYSFIVPSTQGIYIYQTDCLKAAVKYKSLETFHVSPAANSAAQISNLSAQIKFLKDTSEEQVHLVTDKTISTQPTISKTTQQPILQTTATTADNRKINIAQLLIIGVIAIILIGAVIFMLKKAREKSNEKIDFNRDIGNIDNDSGSDGS